MASSSPLSEPPSSPPHAIQGVQIPKTSVALRPSRHARAPHRYRALESPGLYRAQKEKSRSPQRQREQAGGEGEGGRNASGPGNRRLCNC